MSDALRDPATIRARCAAITRFVDGGGSAHFLPVARQRLDDVADRVAALTRRRFPDLRIPLHSRWRHFEAGGVDRAAELTQRLAGRSVDDAARARIDLTVVSVLLDAGAGADWRYRGRDGRVYARSEGLGVASFDAFIAGRFSATPGEPLRADGDALARLDTALLQDVFQVSDANPMVGLDGRAALLARLGRSLGTEWSSRSFNTQRPSRLLDVLPAGACTAGGVLAGVLDLTAAAFAAADVWAHPAVGEVPFHKLSQWLTYSLIEPLRSAGVMVTDLDALTGLPEYRNGGLLLDGGVIVARDLSLFTRLHQPGDEAIVEWRALTVSLLDELAPRVRTRLGLSAAELPLAAMLEGGTWAAGREIAAERRPGGVPPLTIASDGTVF